jgi:phage shock protein A
MSAASNKMLCVVLQALQEKVQQLEAACADARQLHASQVAAHDAAVQELRSQVEQQRLEVKRVRMEAASLTKQNEQALQRLRREADAGGQQEAMATQL